MNAQDRNIAVVIGAGLTGLLTAKILSAHYKKVILFEKDKLSNEPQIRNGVGQTSHPHVLLVKGKAIFNHYFPNLTEELIQKGGIEFDYGLDTFLKINGQLLPNFDANIVTVSASRKLLEFCVRKRVLSVDNIAIIDEREVTELHPSSLGNQKIEAISTVDRHGTLQKIATDLVVDVSGRNSKAPSWLAQIGLPKPEEIKVDPHIGYSTRVYKIPKDTTYEKKAVGVSVQYPNTPSGCAIMKIEKNQLLVTLVGIAKNYPPHNEDAYIKFAKGIPVPFLHHIVTTFEPVSEIRVFRNMKNRLRRYDQIKKMPSNFLVLGDAVCTFNPIYAQGITVGALGAVKLDELLTRGKSLKSFQKEIYKLCKFPWNIATSEDLKWCRLEHGKQSFFDKVSYYYLKNLVSCMTKSPLLTKDFLSVMHMIAPTSRLFKPNTVLQVVKKALFH